MQGSYTTRSLSSSNGRFLLISVGELFMPVSCALCFGDDNMQCVNYCYSPVILLCNSSLPFLFNKIFAKGIDMYGSQCPGGQLLCEEAEANGLSE